MILKVGQAMILEVEMISVLAQIREDWRHETL